MGLIIPILGKTHRILEDLAPLFPEGHWELVSFHPSYSYEDFVEGIRPVVETAEKEGGGIRYEVGAENPETTCRVL